MKPNESQFKPPHPIPALAAGEKPQYENQKHHSPVARYVTNWNAEMDRENGTAKATRDNIDLKDLSAKHAEWEKTSRRHEADQNPYELEVSGDAMSRAKKGQPAKDKFDVKLGFN